MKSILSFKQYDVIETIYKYDPSNKLESENVSPELSLKIQYQDQERETAVLLFSIELGDPQLKDNSFYIKVVISGMFSIRADGELSKEDIDHMYKKNALAILYPYIRSLVSDLSSKGSETPIILPPINVEAMVDNGFVSIEETELINE